MECDVHELPKDADKQILLTSLMLPISMLKALLYDFS